MLGEVIGRGGNVSADLFFRESVTIYTVTFNMEYREGNKYCILDWLMKIKCVPMR